MIIRGLNFASAMARWIAHGMRVCTQEQIEQRLAICEACEFYRDGYCQHCGCPVNDRREIRNKAALFSETCPRNFWETGHNPDKNADAVS